MKINYQLELDKTIKEIKKINYVPRLLLHSCCGPCSTYVLEYLSNYFEISLLYYNPNIYPKGEFFFREQEQEGLIKKVKTKYPIHFLKAEYIPEDYYKLVRGYEKDREGGNRCHICFDMRLRKTASIAKEKEFDYFTTTLSISPHKDSQVLNQIGKELEEEFGVKYLCSDFKKRNGFKRSVELTREYDMYRQDYCGCVFSYMETKERQEKSSRGKEE